MGLDSSIALQLKPVQLDNPLTQFAQVSAIQNAQQQNRLAELAYGEKQREVEQNNALNAAYKGSINPDGTINRNKLYTDMAGAGLGSKLPAIQKGFADSDKSAIDADKAKYETTMKKFEIAGQIMAPVKDQASWEAARKQTALVFGPEAAAQMPEQYDPALVEQKRQQALTVKDQLEQQWKAKEFGLKKDQFGETVRHNGALERNAAGTLAVSQGQLGVAQGNLAVSQGREAREAKEGAGGGKAPSGFRWKADGSLEAIPGGPGDKAAAATEGERKAATLLKRMEGSMEQLDAALKENPDAAKPSVVANGLRAIGAESLANTVAVGSARQRAESAQIDLLDAALTLGTGAAYTREQLQGYTKAYFPQVGDTPDNIKDKADRLKNVIDAAKIAAGRAKTDPATAAQQVKNAVASGEATKLANARPVSVKSAADYAKLPSGTVYMAPDGSMRTKQ